MSIKISLKKNIAAKLIKNYVLFCNHEYQIFGLKKLLVRDQSSFIKKVVDPYKSKKKDFLIFNLNSTQKIILCKIDKRQSSCDNEKKGAKFYSFLKLNS